MQSMASFNISRGRTEMTMRAPSSTSGGDPADILIGSSTCASPISIARWRSCVAPVVTSSVRSLSPTGNASLYAMIPRAQRSPFAGSYRRAFPRCVRRRSKIIDATNPIAPSQAWRSPPIVQLLEVFSEFIPVGDGGFSLHTAPTQD